jgi:glycosyltransferase involved in cell wall biosynthesis
MTRSSFTIGLLAPPWVPVPPPCYGGTELVIDQLARGLVAAGHHVVLYAAPASTAPVPTVLAAPADGEIGTGTLELPHVMSGYEALADCDIVHDHTLLGPAWALALGYQRVVTTCHCPLDGGLREVYRRYSKRVPLVAVSHDQTARAPEIAVDKIIHYGLDPARYPLGRGDGGFLLFLGRMTPDNGVREAVLAARGAGERLAIAAKMRERTEREYFARQVEPLLGDDVWFVGEATGRQKLELLGAAKALLNPIRWPEPFGLVMTEALASGTPVITCRNGSAPEIVDHGVTGFFCHDHDDLVRAIRLIDRLDRGACRTSVVSRFSAERMIDEHLGLYQDVFKR